MPHGCLPVPVAGVAVVVEGVQDDADDADGLLAKDARGVTVEVVLVEDHLSRKYQNCEYCSH